MVLLTSCNFLTTFHLPCHPVGSNCAVWPPPSSLLSSLPRISDQFLRRTLRRRPSSPYTTAPTGLGGFQSGTSRALTTASGTASPVKQDSSHKCELRHGDTDKRHMLLPLICCLSAAVLLPHTSSLPACGTVPKPTILGRSLLHPHLPLTIFSHRHAPPLSHQPAGIALYTVILPVAIIHWHHLFG